MKVKITRIRFASLWNGEYVRFVNQLVEIFKVVNPTVLLLEKALAFVTGMLPSLAKMNTQEESSMITKELEELDMERDALFDSIYGQVKAVAKSPLPEVVEHVKNMEHFFSEVGHDIPALLYNEESQRIFDLFESYDANSSVKQAAEALNLTHYFEKLREVNQIFDTKFQERNLENAGKEVVDARAIRRECDEHLLDLFKTIELNSKENPTLDYTVLSKAMNELIDYYKAQITARATRKKKGEDITKEDPISDFPVAGI